MHSAACCRRSTMAQCGVKCSAWLAGGERQAWHNCWCLACLALVLSAALPACLHWLCPAFPTHCRSLVKVLREGTAGVLPESFHLLALECLLACFVLANLTLPPDALASPASSAAVNALIKRIK